MATVQLNFGIGNPSAVMNATFENFPSAAFTSSTYTEIQTDALYGSTPIVFGLTGTGISLVTNPLNGEILIFNGDATEVELKLGGFGSTTWYHLSNIGADLSGITSTAGSETTTIKGFLELFLVTSDQIIGSSGNDYMTADDGNDTVTGNDGVDVLYGNIGTDIVYGNTGNDVLYGGQDVDRVYGGQDLDLVYGNNGNDLVYGNFGDDTLFGGQDNDTLYGGQDQDNISGNLGNDRAFGNDGNDIIYGNDGADTLDGGAGNDTLYGGAGNDTYTGGAGNDLFSTELSGGSDRVTDFDVAFDKINIEGAGAFIAANVSEDIGGNAVYSFSGGSITLVGVDETEVTSTLFV